MPQPVSWGRVVRASRVLSPWAKLVFDEIRLLDSGDNGAYPRPERLAARLGLSVRGLEGIRQTLTKMGLLVSERRGKKVHWWVRLPEPCYPSERPTDDEVLRFATILDALVGDIVPTPVGVERPTLDDVG